MRSIVYFYIVLIKYFVFLACDYIDTTAGYQRIFIDEEIAESKIKSKLKEETKIFSSDDLLQCECGCFLYDKEP